MPETREKEVTAEIDCRHQWADITVTADAGKCDRFFCIHCGRVMTRPPTIAPNFWTVAAAPNPVPRRRDNAEIVTSRDGWAVS